MTTEQILIVEDDTNILFFLERMLSNQGYRVTGVSSGEAALRLIQPGKFDLAILDLNLGQGISGMDVLARFRSDSADTIIILLTGNGTLETAIESLRQGAHDYLLKPAMAEEIRKSVRAGLEKRRQMQQQRERETVLNQLEQNLEDSLKKLRGTAPAIANTNGPQESQSQTEDAGRYLQHGNLLVDLPRRVVTIDGRPVDLSPTEFDLLLYLLQEVPRIVPPQELVRQIQGYNLEESEAGNITRTHIYRLRQKLKDVAPSTPVIRTVRGIGYTIDL
jgi:DNA-binding response OmpR family regulator